MEKLSIRKFIEEFQNGTFNIKDIDVQISAGWHDWFCKDESLLNKTKQLGKKVIQIKDSPKIDLDKQYVFFKNCCPVNGSLYDQIKICDNETREVVYCITPKSGHKVDNGKGEVWGDENGFSEALFKGSWDEIKKWFLIK